MEKTLNYYNTHAGLFISDTQRVDFHEAQDLFLKELPLNAKILDFGCGSGRDTKYFIEKGYSVDAADGSAEMCKLAAEYTGIPVKQMLFHELNETAVYDGIWACASILHSSTNELKDVVRRMEKALKDGGIVYTSFKYGDFEGERGGRYYIDFTEERWTDFLQYFPELRIKDMWVSGDVRPGRGKEKWLNVLLRKSILL